MLQRSPLSGTVKIVVGLNLCTLDTKFQSIATIETKNENTMDSIARNQLTVVDIRRLEDGPQKPLANAPWPPNHQDILNARCRLPVYGSYDQILDTYHQSQVMIRSGDTGSGKSTQVPQLLVHDEWASGLKVAGTQPRRLAAKELRCSSLGRNEEMGVRDTCRELWSTRVGRWYLCRYLHPDSRGRRETGQRQIDHLNAASSFHHCG